MLVVNQKTGKLILDPVTLVTELLPDVPVDAALPVSQGLDLFFVHKKMALTPSGSIEEVPDMHGVSGASIWELDQTGQAEPWLPERFVKAVGVQSSFSRGNYIRGKSWFAVVNLLAKIDDELKEAISARWGIARDARDIH